MESPTGLPVESGSETELETYLASEVAKLRECLRELEGRVILFERRLERVKSRVKTDDQGLIELEDFLASEIMRIDWAIGSNRKSLVVFERRLGAAQRLRELS
jgi:hypothetical protein